MNINDLRKLARKRHAATTDKISRLRRAKGIEVGGSEHDPRRDPRDISKMRSRELQSYIRKLDAFTSRTKTFVTLAQGQVVSGEQWREYKKAEAQYNRIGRERQSQIAGVKLPGQDLTIAERVKAMTPTIRRASGEASTKPYAEVSRKPAHIASAEALTKLINDMKRKTSRDYLPKVLKSQREQAEHMMNIIGVGDQIKQIRELSDDQFDTLFNETGFASDLGMRYGYMSMLSKGKKNAAHESVMETNERDIAEQISWAKSLPARKRRTRK